MPQFCPRPECSSNRIPVQNLESHMLWHRLKDDPELREAANFAERLRNAAVHVRSELVSQAADLSITRLELIDLLDEIDGCSGAIRSFLDTRVPGNK